MKAFVLLDGTLLPMDRITADRPFHSGKHKKHGMHVQVIADPFGRLLWASPALPGAVHSVRAAREHDIVDALADAGANCWADSDKTRAALEELGFTGEIARKGVPAPIQTGKRWVVERSHASMNGFGKLHRCTEKRQCVVDFYLYLSAAIVTLRMLIRRATPLCRWDGRSTTKRLE